MRNRKSAESDRSTSIKTIPSTWWASVCEASSTMMSNGPCMVKESTTTDRDTRNDLGPCRIPKREPDSGVCLDRVRTMITNIKAVHGCIRKVSCHAIQRKAPVDPDLQDVPTCGPVPVCQIGNRSVSYGSNKRSYTGPYLNDQSFITELKIRTCWINKVD